MNSADEFFAEAKRLKLRMLGTPEETRAALDAKDAEIARLRAALAAQGVPAGCRVVDAGFRWDGEKQQHFPSLLIEFDPVPVNGGHQSKGWRDRDAMAAMLAAAPAPTVKDSLTIAPEVYGVPVPDGLAHSDAAFWLRHRKAILGAIADQGMTLVSTASGCRLMKNGKAEAWTQGASASVSGLAPAQAQQASVDRSMCPHQHSVDDWRLHPSEGAP